MKAYDTFFANFHTCPTLTIESEDFNFPKKEEDVTYVIDVMSEVLESKISKHVVSARHRNQPELFEKRH